MITLPTIQLQPRERLLAVGAGLVLLVIAMDRLVLAPWGGHRQKIRQEIHHMEETLQNHARLLARKDSVLAQHQHYQRYLIPIVADDLQKAAFIQEIEDLAAQTSVILDDIKSSEVEVVSPTKRFSFDIQVDCTPEQWVTFIYRIETSPSLYEVVRAGLSLEEDQAERLHGFLRLVSATLQPEGEGKEGTNHASAPSQK